jgi:hypothetical protein
VLNNTRPVLESTKAKACPSCCCSQKKSESLPAPKNKKKNSDEDLSDGGLNSDQRLGTRIWFECCIECSMKETLFNFKTSSYCLCDPLNVYVRKGLIQSLSSVFVRRLIAYLTLKHLKFTTKTELYCVRQDAKI